MQKNLSYFGWLHEYKKYADNCFDGVPTKIAWHAWQYCKSEVKQAKKEQEENTIKMTRHFNTYIKENEQIRAKIFSMQNKIDILEQEKKELEDRIIKSVELIKKIRGEI